MSVHLCLFTEANGSAIALNPTHIEAVYAAPENSSGIRTCILMTAGGEASGLYRVRDKLAWVLAAITGRDRADLEQRIADKASLGQLPA